MKYGVIDIGSNSVRLMLSKDGKTLYKLVETTRLASTIKDGCIDFPSAQNTIDAVARFYKIAKEEKADEIFAFATAATRNAKNGAEFLSRIKATCEILPEILSGELEAEAGYRGALEGKDGGVIDVGGASTEIAVVKDGKKIYGKSVPVGAVTLTRLCGENEEKADESVIKYVESFGTVPQTDFYCIGGTATSVAATLLGLEIYDADKTHGFIVRTAELAALKKRLYSLPIKERKKLKGLQPERADIIQSGTNILCGLTSYLNIEKFTVSEKDNLEGYLAIKTEKK